ncbi:SIS domain-containing protein [Salinisphaera sp. USBA-960]|uniref:SIS domain-containing protein n=1 Tax=Salinisphaera orenii TaxID=856731 RepID=UPI000DBE5CC2|nr:SIS domain-containing protein [Salifodinibacter halophilus]NNC26130.1 SIS domain-containing protein [Salifodinibacter halophilus]
MSHQTPTTNSACTSATATEREIRQQPAIWRAVHADIQSQRQAIDDFLCSILTQAGVRVVFTGAGTSAFAGDMLASLLGMQLDARVDAVATTDIVARPTECLAPDSPLLLVSIARSGNSPESVAATRMAEQCSAGCYHLILTCNPEGELHRIHAGTDRALLLTMPSGSNDQGFAMTSSLSSIVWAALCVFMPNQADAERTEQIARAADNLLATDAKQVQTTFCGDYDRVVYLGSGVFRGLAQEAALKILELTAGEVVALHDTPLGFRHGPKSLVNDKTLLVTFVSNDAYARRYDEDIVAELTGQNGHERVVAVAASGWDTLDGATLWPCDELAEAPDWMLVFPYLITAQLAALYTSLAHGKTVDNPFPDGDVNRVVQGVTIHPFAAGSGDSE